jgi:RTX calcium-binding nonapeptide repeat (4 copies)
MLAVAFPLGTRALVGALALMVCVGAAVPAVLGNAGARPDRDKLAARLLRLDPGARVGGNTQVASAAGARLLGVPGRVNFMVGLGPRERLVGGSEHDQLGAFGAGGARVHGAGGEDLIHGGARAQVLAGGAANDLIFGGAGHDLLTGGRGHDMIRGGHGHDRIDGGRGHDRIHGGPGRDRLEGGHGRDRLVDRQGATVAVAGPGDRVDVADADSDRVLCAAGSTNRIVVDRGDRLHPNCSGPAMAVTYRRPPNGPPTADAPAANAAQQQQVTGKGSDDNPFTAACDDETQEDCLVSAFPARSIIGLWEGDTPPAYICPATHPYLYSRDYGPFGTTLPRGVEVVGLGPIGVYIGDVSITGANFATGTRNGSGDLIPSAGATNWAFGTNSYRVQLHCTTNILHGWHL